MAFMIEKRGIRLMAALFALLNLVFSLVVFTTLSSEGVFPGIILAALGLLLAAAVLHPDIRHRLYQAMGNRLAVLLPVAWYSGLLVVVSTGDALVARPLLWSAVMTWGATIFFWIFVCWLWRYVERTFTLDHERRRDWRWLVMIATVMSLASFFMPAITVNMVVIPHNYEIERWLLLTRTDEPESVSPNLLTYISYYNTDVPMFIRASNLYPFGWRETELQTWQRPAFFMVSSQLCRLLAAPLEGYASGELYCDNILTGILAYWFVNLGVAIFGAIGVYELVRAYVPSRKAALMAGALTIVTGFTLFFFPIISTDYVELLIAIASLWMLHRLFLIPQYSTQRLLVYGVVFGLLLLLKLNAIFILFGLLLTVGSLRWRLVPVFTLIPLLVFGAYRLFAALLNIPFDIIEAGADWPTVNWITTTFLYDYSLFQKARAITIWSGVTFDKVLYMYAALLFAGVLVMINDPRYPRKLISAAWVLFFCMCAFTLVFQFSYVQHTLGLMPFIYGAVAMGAERASTSVQALYGDRQNGFRARFVAGIVWLLPIIHNLVQILAWGTKDWINYG